MARIKHKPDELVKHTFQVAVNGYNAEQVDKVFDEIISDYRAYDLMHQELQDRVRELETTITNLNAEIDNLRSVNTSLKDQTSGASQANANLLREIEGLQKTLAQINFKAGK